MKKLTEYKMIDFILFPLRCIPFQSIFNIIYMILNALLPAYQTFVIANFVDCSMEIFEGSKTLNDIIIPIILVITYILFINLMPSINNIVRLTGKNKLSLTIQEIVLNKRASLEYMHIENVETQELINRVCSNTVENFESGFNSILTAAYIIISSISLLVIIMTTEFISGIVIISISVPLFIIAMRTGKRTYEMGKETKKIQRKYTYISSVLTDREYAQERKLFGYSNHFQKYYNNLYEQSFKIQSNIEKKRYANMKSGSIVTLLIIGAIILILLPSLYAGKMTVGIFIALVNAIFSLVQTMSWQLSTTMENFSRLREYLKDLNLFFGLSEKHNATVIPVSNIDFEFETLEFRNVFFKYPGTEINVLNNCCFVLKNGKSYSFVGVNGAGKSTIIKLIAGLYDNYEGDILLNGRNIRDYNYATIKSLISVLFQDFATYAITLKENIIVGDNMIYNEEKFKNIVSSIEFDDIFQKLKYGSDTLLGKIKEDSVDISVGQWQKVAIARVLYSNSKIIILDEPTASLDPVTESKIYEMFHKVNNDRFTIYITHRLGAAKIADEILVIDEGRIIESGTHDQLMSMKDGLYHEMFDSQKAWYIND